MDTLGVVSMLSEVERAEYDKLDKTPPPMDLAREMAAPANVGWTLKQLDVHSRYCPAQRRIKLMGNLTLVALGILLALSGVWAAFGKTVMRSAFREELIQQGLIHAQRLPLPDGVAQVQP